MEQSRPSSPSSRSSPTSPSVPASRGHLNPGADGVVFDRFELGPGLDDLVRHVWVVRWSIPEGETREQRMLTYPAFNVVIQREGALLAAPDPKLSVVTLSGSSWAVGVLFRPAAGPLLSGASHPRDLLGLGVPFEGSPEREVTDAMEGLPGDVGRWRLVAALRDWLVPLAGGVGERGRLMNRVGLLAEEHTGILQSQQLAEACGLGMRALERLVAEFVGVTPKWLIECRRLQWAATTLFSQSEIDLSGLAASLGYADYPHFSRRYRSLLGETPEATRRRGSGAPRRGAGRWLDHEAVEDGALGEGPEGGDEQVESGGERHGGGEDHGEQGEPAQEPGG